MDHKNMAYFMAKKKKMAQGGWVEETPKEELHEAHSYPEHFEESEPEEHNLHGTGFSENDIDDHDEKYDVQPKRFASGGMCYSDGGSVHPLDMMFRKKFLEAKKMAYGGPVEPADRETLDESYPSYQENNMQVEHGLRSKPMKHEAEEEDRDRLSFARSFMTKKAMRR